MGIYWRALVPIQLATGDIVRHFKTPLKNTKNDEKIRELLAPSILERYKNMPDVHHNIFVLTEHDK